MMRKYQDKQNVQKKAYHTDRFRIIDELPKKDVNEDEVFSFMLEEFKKHLHVNDAYIQLDQLVIFIDPKDNQTALQAMKDIGFESLSEMSAVDFIAQNGRFEIFYQMLSMKYKKRARIKCFLEQNDSIKSVENIYKSANWAEREMYDMFGIVVTEHSYLKRILMPDDWSGYPLLKTYPLQGDEAAQWYEVDKLFGKEYRDVVGKEQRDSAKVIKNDTINFSRLNHAVAYNTPASEEKTPQEYQEDKGVAIVTKVKKQDTKIIKGRR